jgi:hypothetical protein
VMDDLYFKADCEQSLIIEMGILNVIAALEWVKIKQLCY